MHARDIWRRLIQPKNGTLPQAAARAILALNFSDDDKSRMHQLAQRNGEDKLSPSEQEELHTYILAADILGLFHAKARRSLTRK